MGGCGPGSCASDGSGGKEPELFSLQSLLGIELQFFKVGIKRSSNSSAGSQGLEPSRAHHVRTSGA